MARGVNWSRTDSECHLARRYQEQSASDHTNSGLCLHQQLPPFRKPTGSRSFLGIKCGSSPPQSPTSLILLFPG